MMMRRILFLALLPLLSCLPGIDLPLKADRDADDLFAPSEENLIVVDAILIVDAPLPPITLRRTVAPGVSYAEAEAGLAQARVTIERGDEAFTYRPDPTRAGRYLPPDSAPAVAPRSIYELRVLTEDGLEVRAMTQTPGRLRIAELLLTDDDEQETERRLRLFSEVGDEVYEVEENQLEYTRGELEARIQNTGAVSYQFVLYNLEPSSPLLISTEWIDEEDVDRREPSVLLRLEDDTIFLPWFGIYFAGRYKVKLFAVDQNWFDLVRTDNVDSERGSGEAGQAFQRPLFHVDNGIGLFASAAVDSVGFFVRPEGSDPCSGCECWGCGNSRWSGTLDPNTRSGRIDYEREVASGANCELSYELGGARGVEPCATCAFAWEFTLGALTVHKDDGGCDEAAALSSLTLRFAQGIEVVGGDEDTPKYGLFDGSDEGWEPIESGWSLVSQESETAGQWLFGFVDD